MHHFGQSDIDAKFALEVHRRRRRHTSGLLLVGPRPEHRVILIHHLATVVHRWGLLIQAWIG